MEYLLIAYDGTDAQALDRRMKVREEHLKRIGVLRQRGEFKYGGAILDETGEMIGSMIVYDFPDRQSLDLSLRNELYATEGVWEKMRSDLSGL